MMLLKGCYVLFIMIIFQPNISGRSADPVLMLFSPVGVHLDRLRANGIKSFFFFIGNLPL